MGGPKGPKEKENLGHAVNVLRLVMIMSSFFKVEVQGQMEDLGPLTLTGKRSRETPKAQGALWKEAESFSPAFGWDWGGLTESKGTCDLVWWLEESRVWGLRTPWNKCTGYGCVP